MAGKKQVWEPYNVSPAQFGYDQAASLAAKSMNIPTAVSSTPVYPTKSGDAPAAASNNNSIKPYTNGGINWGQVSALTSGALGMMANYTNTRYQARALDAQALAYLNQRPLNYEAYRTNVNYMAEENFANVSRMLDEGAAFSGMQMTGISASGFDMSSGEHRLLTDTYSKMVADIALANRSAYIQSFELWRNTEMENNRLLAAAQAAKSQAKYARKVSKINLISGAVSTAAGVMSAAYGPKLTPKDA